ncbi:MAG: ferrous iron transporter B [Candidatus Omnitrophica bacterium]|nr:ferrous iron transporter B [Candidatus Omnitrophota bacterium]
MSKVILLGNPNVGKSVIFARLTGIQVVTSNYAGTTVEYRKGYMLAGGEKFEVIDLPGTYSLEPTSKAEEVACQFLKESCQEEKNCVVINIIDATNLERNLHLTLDLISRGYQVLVVLNMCDELVHHGISIDVKKMEELLGVPVVSACAVTGLGIKVLKERLQDATASQVKLRSHEELWQAVGALITQVQSLTHRHHTWREMLEDLSIRPFSGVLMGLGVIYATFKIVRFIAEGLITYVLDPAFNNLYAPVLQKLSALIGQGNFFHHVLIGELFNGKIDFKNSIGLLTTAPYVEFNMVLPYIISFYLVLGLLEDIGYLPRFALLLDAFMHKIGLHGFAIIPVLLGFGCNVPGILATRVLESKRERFISSTLISIAVPCAALQAMVIKLLGPFGFRPFLIVAASLFASWVAIGYILNKVLKGYSPELVLEIPPYRWPPLNIVFSKLWLRVKEFIVDAFPFVILGVLIVNLLQYAQVFHAVSNAFGPLMKTILGLPKEAIFPLVIGFLRKDIAAGLLIPLNMTVKQLIIASVFLSMSFPCIATFIIFLKELGIKYLLAATAIMIMATMFVAGMLNLIL